MAAKRVARVMPAFLVLSIAGCFFGYYVFRVPLNQLGVVVAVPMLGLFAISRVLALALPDSPRDQRESSSRVPRLIFALAAVGFFAGIGAIDFLMSAGVFTRLAVSEAVPHFFRLAEIFAAVSLAGLVASSVLVIRNVMRGWSEVLIYRIWRVLLLPAQLVDLLPHLHKPHQSRQ